MTNDISAVILAKNSETKIRKCLESLDWCSELVIIDDFSSDKTLEVIDLFKDKNKIRIKIHQHQLKGDFSAQRNFGLSKAEFSRILFVDSDEVVSQELAEEIKNLLKSDDDRIKGYFIRRLDIFLGKKLNYGETGNISFLRLGKKEFGQWEGKVHEVWRIKGQTGNLRNPLLHHPHDTLGSFIGKLNKYTTIVAQSWKEQGKEVGFLEILFYPPGKFFNNYILKAGFLDGAPGLIMAVMMSLHSFLARGKLYLSNLKNVQNF